MANTLAIAGSSLRACTLQFFVKDSDVWCRLGGRFIAVATAEPVLRYLVQYEVCVWERGTRLWYGCHLEDVENERRVIFGPPSRSSSQIVWELDPDIMREHISDWALRSGFTASGRDHRSDVAGTKFVEGLPVFTLPRGLRHWCIILLATPWVVLDWLLLRFVNFTPHSNLNGLNALLWPPTPTVVLIGVTIGSLMAGALEAPWALLSETVMLRPFSLP